MRPGSDRTDVGYIWPNTLAPPADGKPLVYLDLNHWIGLAKAAVKHRDGMRYRNALETLRAATAILPLSSTHYMEMVGIKGPQQRRDVADVMEELSGFVCLMPRTIVMEAEADAAICAFIPGLQSMGQRIPLLGLGVSQAFGVRGEVQVRSRDGDVTDRVRDEFPGGPEAFDAFREDAERRLDRSALRGPTDAEVPELRALGWDSAHARRIAEKWADQEREQAQRLDACPQWRRGRLRDVVAARYIIVEFRDVLERVLNGYGVDFGDLGGGPEAIRRFTDSMPSSDVHISLVTAAHRNPQTRWTSNDMFDIDALAVAVPYCDVVVTEKHARHVLSAAGLPARAGTEVLATPDELVTWLDRRAS